MTRPCNLLTTAMLAGLCWSGIEPASAQKSPNISPPNISPMRPDFNTRARDMWQVIDQVNVNYLGGTRNSHRYRTQSRAGAVTVGRISKKAPRPANIGGSAIEIEPITKPVRSKN